jgi:predicted dehydrogenase
MMQFGIYGTKGSLQSEYTDNQPGEVRVALDRSSGPETSVIPFEAERDASAYGHGAAVIGYMRHLQDCLDNDCEPSPSVLDGAKAVAAGAAAWESVKTGKAVEVANDF